MKTTIKTTIAAVLFSLTVNVFAQVKTIKPTVAVLNVDSKGINLDPAQMGNLVRLELEKLDTFSVMDRYDVIYLVDKNKLEIGNCYGKLCLVEVGNTIKSEKMFSGSVELYGESIIITLRLIDVKTSFVEKTQVKEFLNLPLEVQSMIGVTIREMFHRKNEQTIVERLTKTYNYDNAINNPKEPVLKLDGPRMGFGAFTGKAADVIMAKKSEGGYEGLPFMFQFGYQFEKQYLNEGNFQGLFEFLPVITGLDQGRFIPSFTFMNGLRDNRHGWEFAFGPTVSIIKKAEGYYDPKGKWNLKSEWISVDNSGVPITAPDFTSRLDSRGDLAFNTGFILAVGKTFKSGKLNIPVNMYVVPNRDGWRFGASFGFNAKKRG